MQALLGWVWLASSQVKFPGMPARIEFSCETPMWMCQRRAAECFWKSFQTAFHEVQDGQRRENGVIALLLTALRLFTALCLVTWLVATAAALSPAQAGGTWSLAWCAGLPPRCRGQHGTEVNTVFAWQPLPNHWPWLLNRVTGHPLWDGTW